MGLIESALSQGISRINNTPYKGKVVNTHTSFKMKGSLGENSIASLIRNIDLNELNHDEQLLVVSASQFVWGEKPPKGVDEVLEGIKSKFDSGMKISKNEAFLLRLSQADTDYF